MATMSKSPGEREYQWYRTAIMVDGRTLYSTPVLARTKREAIVQSLALAAYNTVVNGDWIDRTRPAEGAGDPRQDDFTSSEGNGEHSPS